MKLAETYISRNENNRDSIHINILKYILLISSNFQYKYTAHFQAHFTILLYAYILTSNLLRSRGIKIKYLEFEY